MKLGIDASNLRYGGGITHLVELLRHANPADHGFDHVVVWGCDSTLDLIESRKWLAKKAESFLNKSLPFRAVWQKYMLAKEAKKEGCDLLFVPGGSYRGNFRPFVTMSRNMLHFDWGELKRYTKYTALAKSLLLRKIQLLTFADASGVIFLSSYARDTITNLLDVKSVIIPHGLNNVFDKPPRAQKEIKTYSFENPFKLLYVSHIALYKYQWNVIEAVSSLRRENIPVSLDLVGLMSHGQEKFTRAMDRYDPDRVWVDYRGFVEYDRLSQVYVNADAFVFASGCENLPNTLLEAMLSGLPIACSNKRPMPDILKNGGVYFDPHSPPEIADAIRTLVENSRLRSEKALMSYSIAQNYNWEKCAASTFEYLHKAVNRELN